MNFVQIKTGSQDIDRRLDRVLRKLLPQIPLNEIYKHLRKGTIKVNSKKVQQNYRIIKNDVIFLASHLLNNQFEKTVEQSYSTKEKNLETIFCNEHIKVINKPYGISVHKSNPKEISLAEIIASEYKKTHKNESLSFIPGPLHRLDKNTSGIVVFSQSLKGAQWFSENISLFTKEYIGIVRGNVEKAQYWIDFIDDVPKEKGSAFKTVRISSSGKEARTKCTPLFHSFFNEVPVTLCNFIIETGRKHQIRAQSAFHGFHLLGDKIYGDDKKCQTDKFYLHALRLSVPQNPIQIPEILEASLPPDFQNFLELEMKYDFMMKL